MSACMKKCLNCGHCMEGRTVEVEPHGDCDYWDCYECGMVIHDNGTEHGGIIELGSPQTVDPCEQKPEGWIE